MTDMPPLLGHEHAFVARRHKELPLAWQGTEAGFLEECAGRTNRPLARLTAEVLFELPECLLSREYQLFLENRHRGSEAVVGVAITNVDDFAKAHGKGTIGAAIQHLQRFGYPSHFMRVCFESQPSHLEPTPVLCVDFSRTNG